MSGLAINTEHLLNKILVYTVKTLSGLQSQASTSFEAVDKVTHLINAEKTRKGAILRVMIIQTFETQHHAVACLMQEAKRH